jgi:hypothetical protein
MSEIQKPDKFPRWATSNAPSAQTGVNNVVEPPESKKNVGWNFGEPPARSFFNWLGRKTYEWLIYLDSKVDGLNKVSDGNGVTLFDKQNVLCVLYAVQASNPNNYVHAVGYRAGGAPVLTVLNNNTLSIGTPLANGTVPVTGASFNDIVIYGRMAK